MERSRRQTLSPANFSLSAVSRVTVERRHCSWYPPCWLS